LPHGVSLLTVNNSLRNDYGQRGEAEQNISKESGLYGMLVNIIMRDKSGDTSKQADTPNNPDGGGDGSEIWPMLLIFIAYVGGLLMFGHGIKKLLSKGGMR